MDVNDYDPEDFRAALDEAVKADNQRNLADFLKSMRELRTLFQGEFLPEEETCLSDSSMCIHCQADAIGYDFDDAPVCGAHGGNNGIIS